MMMILAGLSILIATFLLAFALIFTARSRRHRHAELIMVLTVFWALITAGSLLYAANAHLNWSKEYALRLQTGYLDPQDTDDAPRFPWAICTTLGLAYITMTAWGFTGKPSEKKS